MKIDLHTHCRPVSCCASLGPEEMAEHFKNNGLDAIVVTNHYHPGHCGAISEDLDVQKNVYAETVRRCREKGKEIGLKVFFGAELKLVREPNEPEFLLYGLSEELFLETYPLYCMSQKELFDFCNEHDILMVQAHPYRTEQGYAPADMNFVHGVEVYNPHFVFETRFEDALALAEKHSLLKTAGSDFHVPEQVGMAYIEVPDDIEDQFALRDFLKKGIIEIYNKEGRVY